VQTLFRFVDLDSKTIAMARQNGDAIIEGTFYNMTFYQMWGKGYVRSKSSLTAERVMEDPTFEKTRRYARDLGLAARLASPVYKSLPLEKKSRWMYRAIAGEAASLLYRGKTEEEVVYLLWEKYIHVPMSLNENRVKKSCLSANTSVCKKTKRALWKIFRDRWEEQGKPVSIFKYIWEPRGVFKPECVPKRLGRVPVI
jgi:hypothetical protein